MVQESNLSKAAQLVSGRSTVETPGVDCRPLVHSQSLVFIALCLAKILDFNIFSKQ